jgi:hypothetical protein
MQLPPGMGLTGPQTSLQDQVTHLTKVVHVLWKEVERLEQTVHLIPEGLQIKAGQSEVLVLKNGGILLNGLRINIKTPGKGEFYF